MWTLLLASALAAAPVDPPEEADDADTSDEDREVEEPADEEPTDDEAPPPGLILLPAPGELPSTIDPDEELPPSEPLPSILEQFDQRTQAYAGSRFGFRPILALQFTTEPEDRFGARIGGTFLHHWWTIPRGEKQLVWSGETTVSASGSVGGVRGWETEITSLVGPWLGPVSVRVGPLLRGDRVRSLARADFLDDALLLGFRGTVTVDAEYVLFTAGASPGWRVAGQREASPLLDGVTELDVHGGLAGRFRLGLFKIQAGAGTRVRLTAIGPVSEVHLMLHLALGVRP